MKNFIASMLLFCFTVVAIAQEPKSHDSVKKQEIKTEMVLPSLDLDFAVAIYLPLDVYAPEGQAIDYSFEKTESGFTAINEKPPLQEAQTKSKARKKWIWHNRKISLLNIPPERQEILTV